MFPYVQGGSTGDAGDSTPGTGGTTEGEEGNSGGTGAGTSGSSGGGEGETPPKTFTQEEVNALVSRETAKAQRGKVDPQELGFKSKQELQEAIDAAKKATDDAKSEAEKALETAKKEAAEEAKRGVLSQAQQIMLRAEFKLGCVEHKVTVPADDAFLVAAALPEWKDVKVDDEGKVDGLDKDFFDELKKSKPYLFEESGAGAGGRGDIGAGAGAGGGGNPDLKEQELRKTYPALGGRGRRARAAR